MWGAAVLVLAVTVSAAPQVSFPFNAQVPPVAHVGEPFNFQFASTTFEPNFATLQYSLTGNPSWLSLDGATRALWGTPGANDVGSPTFTIIAAGAAGAVANMQATLVVVEPGGPTASGNVSEQLLTAGKLSGPSSLALLPSTGFDFKFSTDTFMGNGKNLSYYATLSDHTPLPSWVAFNSESLQFSGSTPQVGASPQSFEILLIASDILGFAGTWIAFTLVVSKHTFVFSPWKQTINTPKGATVNFTSLRSHLTLDGGPIVDADLQSATAELPFWLSFDPDNFAVTGTPPSGLASQDISIEAKDKYGDVANTTIYLAFISPLFSGEVGQLNATAGQNFNYTLGRSIFAQGDEEISMDFGSAGKWLHFDPTTLNISGRIPAGTAPLDIQVTLMARSTQEKALNDSQTFNIHVIALEAQNPVFGTTTTSIPSSKTSGTVSPTDATGADSTAGSEKPNSLKKIIIIGAVVASICAILVVHVLAMFLCNRPRRWRRKPKSPTRPEISGPIMQTDEWEDVGQNLGRDLEKGQVEETQERTPDQPPQPVLELPLKSLKQNRNRESIASFLSDGEAKVPAAFDRSSSGYKEEIGPSHNPHESMKIPTEMARLSRRISETSNSPTKRHHRTLTAYRDSYRSVGLPVNRRLTGLGHGRNTYSSSRSTGSFSAFRHTRDCSSFSSYSTQSTSMLSTTTCAFPQPPIARHTMHYMTSAEKCRSIRLVSSVCDSLPDRRTLSERRQSYIRNRATNRSPFFAAGSSRASSSSYKPPVLGTGPSPSTSSQHAVSTLPTTVRPSDGVFDGDVKNRFPGSLRTHCVSNSVVFGSTNQEFPGSLRKHGPHRSIGTNRSVSSSTEPPRWDRPGYQRRGLADGFPRPVTSRSTRESLRRHGLKGSFSSLQGSKIFEDAEKSESTYPSESSLTGFGKKEDDDDDDISGRFALPPVRPSPARKSRRESKKESKRASRFSEALNPPPAPARKPTRNLAPARHRTPSPAPPPPTASTTRPAKPRASSAWPRATSRCGPRGAG
jgi:Putative Ig domain